MDARLREFVGLLERHLVGYIGEHNEVPPISLQCVMKSAAGPIKSINRGRLRPRKDAGT